MINILKTPPENSVLLDANNSVISIQSTLGAGHYFRALIYIDNVLFDTQGWSRQDNFIANKDLKKLYAAYFSSTFSPEIVGGLVEQNQFVKKVNITINEHVLATDALVKTVNLPMFNIMHNQVPESFSDETKVQFLDIQPEVMQIPQTAQFAIPFFVNATDENVIVKLYHLTTIVNRISIALVTGKKSYLYTVDLSALVFPTAFQFLNLEVAVGTHKIYKTFKFFILPNYPIKTIAYKNNFGFYLRGYFDGELEIANDYKAESYTQLDGTDKIFEINENANYNINTGSLLANEKAIIRQICTSLDNHFLYENQWLEILTKTKKFKEFKDNNHSFNEDLVFSFSKNRDVSNKTFISVAAEIVVPITPVITVLIEDFGFQIITPGSSTGLIARVTGSISNTYFWEIISNPTGLTLQGVNTEIITLSIASDYETTNGQLVVLKCTVTAANTAVASAQKEISVFF